MKDFRALKVFTAIFICCIQILHGTPIITKGLYIKNSNPEETTSSYEILYDSDARSSTPQNNTDKVNTSPNQNMAEKSSNDTPEKEYEIISKGHMKPNISDKYTIGNVSEDDTKQNATYRNKRITDKNINIQNENRVNFPETSTLGKRDKKITEVIKYRNLKKKLEIPDLSPSKSPSNAYNDASPRLAQAISAKEAVVFPKKQTTTTTTSTTIKPKTKQRNSKLRNIFGLTKNNVNENMAFKLHPFGPFEIRSSPLLLMNIKLRPFPRLQKMFVPLYGYYGTRRSDDYQEELTEVKPVYSDIPLFKSNTDTQFLRRSIWEEEEEERAQSIKTERTTPFSIPDFNIPTIDYNQKGCQTVIKEIKEIPLASNEGSSLNIAENQTNQVKSVIMTRECFFPDGVPTKISKNISKKFQIVESSDDVSFENNNNQKLKSENTMNSN